MTRLRSREAETEDVNARRQKRGSVTRRHLARWAVGHDELAPGIVSDTHLHPSTVERVRELASGAGIGQLLVVTATGQSFASGGDYMAADSIAYQHGFGGVTAAGDSIVWPVDAVGEIQVEFAWDTYDGGGTIEIEVNGVVPAWGLIAEGDSGREGCKRRGVRIAEGAVVKVKVTQSSGAAQTGDVLVEFSIPDPSRAAGRTGYRALVLADGPVAYWRLGEATGATAHDETGNGHDGTYVSTVLGTSGLIAGDPNTAVTFVRASSSRVEVPDATALDFAGTVPFTVEAWIQPGAFGSGDYYQVLSKDMNAGGGGGGWEVYVESGAAWFGRRDGAGQDLLSAGLTPGAHHLVAVYDGAVMIIYVDGGEAARMASSRSLPGNSINLWIGNEAVAASPYEGIIDEVALYDTALSPGAVAQHYAVGMGL